MQNGPGGSNRGRRFGEAIQRFLLFAFAENYAPVKFARMQTKMVASENRSGAYFST